MPEPPRSGFTQALVRANGLDARGFAGWHVAPEMGYGAARAWWGSGGPRPRPHEGVDLCLYRDGEGALARLEVETWVPAAYDGTVVRVCEDYIGRSVMMAHTFAGRAGWFYTLYGHTRPCAELVVGQAVRAGQIVARLAPVRRRATVRPHLHVSVGWSREPVAPERLDWDVVAEVLRLVDPLPLIS